MHDEILRYHVEGEMSGNVVHNRQELITHLEIEMKDDGVTRSIDVDPQFTLDYRPETETYKFSLSVYGVYVGGEESWRTSGVMNGKKIMKSIPPTKSKQS